MKRRPERLKVGDTVGLVALSSPLNMEELPLKLEMLESLGLKVKIGKTVAHFDGYLAGTDEERAEDFHEMIEDPDVKGIFCVRGGYGIGRLADLLRYPFIEDNPKVIWGFSDVTYLHSVINKFSDLVTFHGPMLSRGDEKLDDLSRKMFQQLFQPMEIFYTEQISPLQTISGGVVQEEIVGGNLNRLVSTLGTKYEVDFTNKIVLLEDVNENVERIDNMLNQLRLARKLEQAAGIALGSFTKLAEGETEEDVYRLFKDYLGGLGKPVVAGFRIGHCEPNIGIPLGVEAILDAENKVLRLLPGVK